MIDLYFWPTPNGLKITLLLEELGVPYALKPVNIGKGEQFAPAFLAIAPNNRMPAIVDHAPADGGAPISVFESGAILLYLADKYGRFLPKDARGRAAVTEWLMWQMGGVGPMMGQYNHFASYAPEKIPYAIERYFKETSRLLAVLDKHLGGRELIAGELSIADFAILPWVAYGLRAKPELGHFPEVLRWMAALEARPAIARGMAVGAALRSPAPMDDEAKKVLFGQSAATIS